jgi:hypothetical protein
MAMPWFLELPPIPLWEDSAILMAGVERDTRSASRSINHRLLPTTVSAVS